MTERPHVLDRLGTRMAAAFAATAIASVVLVLALVLVTTTGGIDQLTHDQRVAVMADVTSELASAYELAGGWEEADLLPAHLIAASASAVLVVTGEQGEVLPEPPGVGPIRDRIQGARPDGSPGPTPITTPEPTATTSPPVGPDGPPESSPPPSPAPSPTPRRTTSPDRAGPGDPEPGGRAGPTATPEGRTTSPRPTRDRGPDDGTAPGAEPGAGAAALLAFHRSGVTGLHRYDAEVTVAVVGPAVMVELAAGETPDDVEAELESPVVVGNRDVGTAMLLFAARTGATPLDVFRRSFLSGAVWAGVAAVLVGLAVAAAVATRLSRPLRRLTAVVDRIAHRDSSARADLPRSVGELGVLARSVNRMAEDLEREDRLRRALVADLAHEVRTPLSVLLAEVEALQDGIVEPDADRLSSLHEEVLRLTRLIEDLDAIAAAEAAVTELHREPVDLAEVAAAALEGLGDRFAMRDIAVTTTLSPARVVGDRRRLEQVVRNLLTNAAKFAPAGGAVSLAVNARRDRAVLEVTDDGPGIPDDELDRLFERFWRGRAAAGVPGSGIGLAVVAELVGAHGGEVAAENLAEGGVRFSVSLPVGSWDDPEGRRPAVLVEVGAD